MKKTARRIFAHAWLIIAVYTVFFAAIGIVANDTAAAWVPFGIGTAMIALSIKANEQEADVDD